MNPETPRLTIRLSSSKEISVDELALSARNHGMPLEAPRYPITPLGLHYLLTHYDIPHVDPAMIKVKVDTVLNGAGRQPTRDGPSHRYLRRNPPEVRKL